jgi:hypothetical protein
MRPHRLVVISAVVLSATVSTGADARPRFPFILGAVLGSVGGMIGHHRGYARYHARRIAARSTEEPSAAEQPGSQPGPPRANQAGGQATWAGPVFWPQLYDDVFDYVFWPSGNGDRFWTYGYGDIVDGAFRPAGNVAERYSSRSTRGQTIAVAGAAAGAAGPCTGEKRTQSADALIERIEQTIQPTEAQQPLLAELRAPALRALEYVDAACPADRRPTPTSRLDVMEDRFWAARQALMITRAPLEKFYAALTDEQKARLNGPQSLPAQLSAGCNQAKVDLPIAALAQRPSQQLRGERRGEPRGDQRAEQRAGIEALRTTSAGLAKLVAASCPITMPATPVQRLDIADKRLNSLLYAVVTLRAPLDAMYGSAGDEQKARPNGGR